MKKIYFAGTRALEAFYDLCSGHPKKTVAIFLVLIAVSLALLPRLKSELRIYDLRDPRFPSTIDLQQVKNQFSLGNSVFVVIANKNGDSVTEGQLCDLQQWLTSEVRTNDELLDTFSPLELRRGIFEENRMWYKKIFDLDCREGGTAKGTTIEGSMAGSPWVGSLTSRDMNDISVEFKFRDTEGESRYGRFNPAPIGALWSKFRNEFLSKHPELTAYLGGRSAFQWHYQTLLKMDAWVNLLTVLVLLLVCRYFYGTWASGIFLVLSLVVSLAFLLGGMAAFGAPIDLLTNSLFVMMCVATIEDLVFVAHMLAQKREDGNAAFRRLMVPAFLTTFTTVVGFASLGLSDLSIIRRFGAWGAAAAGIEWLVTFFLLPSLISVLGRSRTWVKESSVHWHERVASYVPAKRWPVAAVLIFMLGLAGLTRINFNDSPRDAFAKTHMHRQAYEYVSATRGWESTISVLFNDVNEREKNQAILESFAGEKNIASIESPYAIAKFIGEKLPSGMKELAESDFRISSLWERYVSKADQMLAIVYLKNYDTSELSSTIEFIRSKCGDVCKPVGEGVVYSDYTKSVVRTLLESLALSLLIVGLTLLALAWIHDVPHKLAIVYSMLWCPIVAMGLVGLSGITVNFVTCLFAPVFVGLAGDNIIQYILSSSKNELGKGIESRGGASVQLSAMAIATSLTFVGFTLVPMRILGGLLAGGFLLLVAGDLLLLKSLISRKSEEHDPRPSRPSSAKRS